MLHVCLQGAPAHITIGKYRFTIYIYGELSISSVHPTTFLTALPPYLTYSHPPQHPHVRHQSCPIKAAAGSHTARALGFILRVLKYLFIDFLWLLLHWSSLSLLDRPEIAIYGNFVSFIISNCVASL